MSEPRPPLPPFDDAAARREASIDEVALAETDRRIFGLRPAERDQPRPPR